MSWKVYTRLMRPILQEHKPIQPRREDRHFLRFADKPDLPVIEPEGDLRLNVQPIVKVAPRQEIPGLNFKALQFWLDHLGPAIYNPIVAYEDDEGNYHPGLDGSHRTRCLWEIGEPDVRILTWNTPQRP